MKIYHNPRCSKSRQSLQLLQEKGINAETIEYLKSPPTAEEIFELVAKLGIKPEALIRKGEADYKENFKGKTMTDQQWIEAMAKFPKLIERPIVIEGNKAVIGRPPTLVLDLI